MIALIFRPWCAVVGHDWIATSKDARAFLFCDRCAKTTHGWELTATVSKGTKAQPKARVLPFQRSA